MSIYDFLKEKTIYIISTSLVAILTIAILWALNPVGGSALSAFIGILYIIGAAIPIAVEYMGKRDFYRNLLRIFDSLDRKNLIAEMINPPSFKEGIILYDIIKGCNKAMLEEIKQRVHENRWEISASTWVEPDKNTPSGESFARHILYTKKYLGRLLDIDESSLNLDFEPDTFGNNI
jgi:hypothetical protein